MRLPLPRTREIPDTDYGCEIFSAHWFNAIVAGALKWTGYWQLRIRRRVNAPHLMGLKQKPSQKPTRMKDYTYFELMKVEGVGPKTAQAILGKLASGRDLTAKEREYLNASGLG